jgi:hypothetical protein
MIFAVTGAVLSGAAAAWLAQTFAAHAAERRELERQQRVQQRARLETTRAEQLGCFENYLAISSALLGSSSDTDRLERRYFTEASRLAAAERLAERQGAALYARAYRVFNAEVAADIVRALRQAATGRYRSDLPTAERAARDLDQKSQDAMLAAIQATGRELGDKERRPSSTSTALPARVSLLEPALEFAPPQYLVPGAELPAGWQRCTACAAGMPAHFDWCAQCGQRKSPPPRAAVRSPAATPPAAATLTSLPPVLFDSDAVESLLSEQLQETPAPDPLLRLPAPAALPASMERGDVSANGNGASPFFALDSDLAPESDDERYRSRQPPPPSIPPRWSVVFTNGEAQEMTLDELSSMIHEGRVAPGTLVRKEGMATYAEVDQFSELHQEPVAAEQ